MEHLEIRKERFNKSDEPASSDTVSKMQHNLSSFIEDTDEHQAVSEKQEDSEFRTVRFLGGSTGANLVEDTKGELKVLKRGASAEHILEESLADKVYSLMGVPVPRHEVKLSPDGPVKVAQYIDDARILSSLMHDPEAAEQKKQAIEQLQQHFVVDALLANWDVCGLVFDNILIKDNQAYRIDNGGSLRFRAQGALKGEAFSSQVGELNSMRTMGSAAEVFGSVTEEQIKEQITEVLAHRRQIVSLMPPELADIMSQRIASLEEYLS